MSLPVHLLVHFTLALLVGWVVWKVYGKPLHSFLGAVAGGFFIDLDHILDYFFAFGFNLYLSQFFKGMQFLKSDKMYLLFHGWEYVLILIVFVIIVKSRAVKAVLLGLAFGSFVHLCTDIVINEGMSMKGYSIMYRVSNDFEIEYIVTPEHYEKHMKVKTDTTFK
ncbi:hypothetical protein ACFL2R_00660 [Patescibacteria group bacterium]